MTGISEFQFTVPASRIGAEPFKTDFTATERDLQALARRLGIVSVDRLEGQVSLHRESDGMTIGVLGQFRAGVTQSCVTTLEPVKDTLEETFEGWFLDESQATSFGRARKRKIEVDSNDEPLELDEAAIGDERDDPEPIVGGVVDVGELVAQYLSLALNPYPHSEKALAAGPVGDEATLAAPSPFAVLKDWKAQ